MSAENGDLGQKVKKLSWTKPIPGTQTRQPSLPGRGEVSGKNSRLRIVFLPVLVSMLQNIFCRRSTRSGWRMRFQWRLRGCTIRTCSFSSTGTNSRYIFEPFEPSWGSILNNHLSYILLVPANSFDSFFGTIRDWTHIGSSSTSCLFKLIEPNN